MGTGQVGKWTGSAVARWWTQPWYNEDFKKRLMEYADSCERLEMEEQKIKNMHGGCTETAMDKSTIGEPVDDFLDDRSTSNLVIVRKGKEWRIRCY